MVRLLRSVCKSARPGKEGFLPVRPLLALALASPLGCGSVRTSLAAEPPTPQVAVRPNQDPQALTRLQKADSESRKRGPEGSILDLASYQLNGPSESQLAARIRATVNGVAILDEEIREEIYPYLKAIDQLPEPERSIKQKEIFEKELQQLIERELILQDLHARLKDRASVLDKLKEAADKEFDKKMRQLRQRTKVKTDEELKAYLRVQGLSYAGIRRQVQRSFMAMEYMRNLIFPKIDRIGHEQIEEYYKQHPEEFTVPDSVVWHDLFLDARRYPSREAARQAATQLLARARAGEDFQKLVRQHDQGDSSYRNGEGYGHRRGEIKPPDAENYLFRMREGEMANVELANGFHLIRLVKREVAGLKPFEDDKTQAAIRDKLKVQAFERESKRVVADLKRKATIEIAAGTN